jgi:hypothetical protein
VSAWYLKKVKRRLERRARNEALLREVNERIDDVRRFAEPVREADEFIEFHCECGDCTETLLLTASEYETVRAQDDRFAVRPGHETLELERVVERSDRYVVVDKVPAADEFVWDDPRGMPSN